MSVAPRPGPEVDERDGYGNYGKYAPYTSYKREPLPEAEASSEERREVSTEEVKREPAPKPAEAPEE